MSFKLTIRHGPKVDREEFETLDEAIAAMRAHADAVRSEGALAGVDVLRRFDPGARVAARLEISSGGWLRGRDAGVDVMGDGRLVPYAGGLRRRQLQPRRGEDALDAVRAELAEPGSYAAGRRARLPQGAEPPIAVYVNGVQQQQGVDYELRRGEVVFNRPILKERVGTGRWLAMYLGLFGTYRKHETVDVEYRRGAGIELAADVEILPD